MRGFTLVELLLAIALFALLMAGYYVAFTNVLVLEEHARAERAFGAVGPAILDVIEDDLTSLYTHPREAGAFPLRGEDVDLSGEPADRIAFVAQRSSIHTEEIGGGEHLRSPVNEVGYRVAHGPQGPGRTRRLFRRESYYVDAAPLAGGQFYEVYDQVVAFDVTYAGVQENEEARRLGEEEREHRLSRFESWDSEQRRGLPAAVLVRLTVEPPVLRPVAGERGAETPPRQTFVRVIPLVHAHDVPPTEGGETAAELDGTARGGGRQGR